MQYSSRDEATAPVGAAVSMWASGRSALSLPPLRQASLHLSLLTAALVAFVTLAACAPDASREAVRERAAAAQRSNITATAEAGVPTAAATAAGGQGYSKPENIVFDSVADVFLVSNVNGGAVARDSNGYISRVSPDGRILDLKWIDGSRAATRLDGPKGLAIRGDTLAVADVGAVRLFNRRTGAAMGVWTVPGELMNDVSFTPAGTLYVTDTGPGKGLPNSSDHDAIYRFDARGQPSVVARDPALNGPDGLVASDSDLVYATFGADSVVRIARGGAHTRVAVLPGGKVDGLRRLPDGSYVVTSWDAGSVFRIMPDGSRRTELTGVTSPAGVTFDSRRNRLAVTSMKDNAVYLVPLR